MSAKDRVTSSNSPKTVDDLIREARERQARQMEKARQQQIKSSAAQQARALEQAKAAKAAQRAASQAPQKIAYVGGESEKKGGYFSRSFARALYPGNWLLTAPVDSAKNFGEAGHNVKKVFYDSETSQKNNKLAGPFKLLFMALGAGKHAAGVLIRVVRGLYALIPAIGIPGIVSREFNKKVTKPLEIGTVAALSAGYALFHRDEIVDAAQFSDSFRNSTHGAEICQESYAKWNELSPLQIGYTIRGHDKYIGNGSTQALYESSLTGFRDQGVSSLMLRGIQSIEVGNGSVNDNPYSTASGPYQYIYDTWYRDVVKYIKDTEYYKQQERWANEDLPADADERDKKVKRDAQLFIATVTTEIEEFERRGSRYVRAKSKSDSATRFLRYKDEPVIAGAVISAKIKAKYPEMMADNLGRNQQSLMSRQEYIEVLTDFYLEHFLGEGGKDKLLRGLRQNPGHRASDSFASEVFSANPFLKTSMSYKQMYDAIEAMVAGKAGSVYDMAAAGPQDIFTACGITPPEDEPVIKGYSSWGVGQRGRVNTLLTRIGLGLDQEDPEKPTVAKFILDTGDALQLQWDKLDAWRSNYIVLTEDGAIQVSNGRVVENEVEIYIPEVAEPQEPEGPSFDTIQTAEDLVAVLEGYKIKDKGMSSYAALALSSLEKSRAQGNKDIAFIVNARIINSKSRRTRDEKIEAARGILAFIEFQRENGRASDPVSREHLGTVERAARDYLRNHAPEQQAAFSAPAYSFA